MDRVTGKMGPLERLDRGEITVEGALKELKEARSREKLGGFPIWFRLRIAGGGKGIRMRLPMFLIGPLFLALMLLSLALLFSLGLVVLAILAIVRPEAGRWLKKGLSLTVPACLALMHLFFAGRGAGIEATDGEDGIVVRLE